MTPAERRRVARVLREAARIVAEDSTASVEMGVGWYIGSHGACKAIALIFVQEQNRAAKHNAVWAFTLAMAAHTSGPYYWPRDEEHRSVRVIALLLTAEAVLTGDCDD